jgi:CheY-like chemotaxis protein
MKRIMLVDDDNVHHVVTGMLLKRLPYDIETSRAMNGLEAINMLKADLNEPPDLILLDLNMPVMNGWDFLEIFKDLMSSFSKVPVICILSSTIAPDDIERSKMYDTVECFLSKPLLKADMQNLLTTLNF